MRAILTQFVSMKGNFVVFCDTFGFQTVYLFQEQSTGICNGQGRYPTLSLRLFHPTPWGTLGSHKRNE
jgi:hypothetical protein